MKNKTPMKSMSFEEYKKQQSTNPMKELANALNVDNNEEIDEFQQKLDYYINGYVNLHSHINEIKELWKDLIKVHQDSSIDIIIYDLNGLASLTVESNIDKESRKSLDILVTDFIQKKLNKDFNTKKFDFVLPELLKWYNNKIEYYKILSIGSSEDDLDYLRHIATRYSSELEQTKFNSPYKYISFCNYVKWFYKHLPDICEKDYSKFWRIIMLGNITTYRNIGEYEKMSETIYEYNKIKKENKYIKWFLEYFFGFGEKPLRILRLYIVLHIIFIAIYFIPIFKFNSIDESINWLEKIVKLFYFNNTTFLTIGYGDIYPSNIQTMLLVVLEQILGFITAGAFVTLTLRKMFRF